MFVVKELKGIGFTWVDVVISGGSHCFVDVT